ncbi:MAG: porin family protein [Verrucomicrobiae bacterium]|nr:porin family protein [Verrucomicrobiae bacterium]
MIAAAGLATPSSAADLRGMKNGYAAPLPHIQHSSAGPCYFRADVGFSGSNDPDIKWPVNNISRDTNLDNIDPITGLPEQRILTQHVTDKVTNATVENTWLAEGGAGCAIGGSRGVRFEAMLGHRGEREINGQPGVFTITDTTTAGGVTAPTDPTVAPTVVGNPLHAKLSTYTLMLHAYKDFGNFGGFIPYLGAGIGAAYHQLGDIGFSGNPDLSNTIRGDNDLSFAWSLMAGVGYQISDKAIIDVGYRYIDLGKISSQRSDSAGFVNPAVTFDDLTAHEVKVGLRYHFGGEAVATQFPLK